MQPPGRWKTASGNIPLPNSFHNVRFTDGSRRVVLDNELALIDDCIDITGTVPIGGGSATEQFHVNLPQGGGNASLQNVLALRATGVMMEVGVPDPNSPDAGTQPTNPPHDFPQVPEFSFYNYDHLGNTRVLYHNYFTSCTPGGTRYVLEHVLDYYPYGRPLREYILTRDRFQTTYHERDEESGLDYRGARFYDGDIGVFLSCDPLAVEYAAWSTYNYVLGNPVRLVDPDGRSVENTIFLDNNGNEIGRTEDNLPNAIVVVGDENMSKFNQNYMGAVLSPDGIGDNDVASLRGHGDSYMVDGMEDLYEMSMARAIPLEKHSSYDARGNKLTDLHPEYGAYFDENNGILSVDKSSARTDDIKDFVGLAGERPAIHTHPHHGGIYGRYGEGPAKEKRGPRMLDWMNSAGRQRIKPSRFLDVVIDDKAIYFFKGFTDKGTVDRSFSNNNIFMMYKIGFVKFVVVLIFLESCTHYREKSCTEIKNYPSAIIERGLEKEFDTAKWELYKLNLVNGDSFMTFNPFYIDTIIEATQLSELELEYDTLTFHGDTLTMVFFFEKGVGPATHSYFHSWSFWGDTTNFLINYLGSIVYPHQKGYYEIEFRDYLLENKEKLSPSLKCLAIERGKLSADEH